MPTTDDKVSTIEPTASSEVPAPLSDEVIASSSPFVGQWSRLVSSTNWDKGRIISEWRGALEEQGAAVTELSDEAWARLVGGVTSQHVGRLRRVHDRFSSIRESYEGLYWSHYQAAIDWQDAEMWLEGAITNKWSVSQMRAARWEAVGAPDGVRPTDDEVFETEIDEDSYASLSDREKQEEEEARHFGKIDERSPLDSAVESPSESDDDPEESDAGEPRVKPFKDLAELPEDISEAFEQFKLAILTHKLGGWQEISCDELLASLDALKALATAPSSDN